MKWIIATVVIMVCLYFYYFDYCNCGELKVCLCEQSECDCVECRTAVIDNGKK